MTGTHSPNAQHYLDDLAHGLAGIDAVAVDRLADLVFDAWSNDATVLVFGNGGSAYNASHFVTDLVKTAMVEGRRRLRALSLVDNTGLLTAVGNDLAYGQTLSFPLETYARRGDLAIAISCSGNSTNVVAACRWAKDHGLALACLTGTDGGQIGGMADAHVHVPSNNFGVIEDLHLSVGHMIAQSLHARLVNETGGDQ